MTSIPAVLALGILQVLIITFTRSGGLVSAPALRVAATVTLESSQAVVTADPDYRRELNKDESQQLFAAASAILQGGGAPQAPSTSPARDAYQFVFTIREGARDTTVTATAGSADNGPIQQLAEWADHEATAIIRARSKR